MNQSVSLLKRRNKDIDQDLLEAMFNNNSYHSHGIDFEVILL